jgi:hypothetical protein
VSESAVVTGASSGIGAAVAERLAARGYHTLLIGRDEQRLQTVTERCLAHAPSTSLSLDLSQLKAIEPAVTSALNNGAPITVLVNAAGEGIYRPFLEQSIDDHDRLMRVNYGATERMIRMVLPDMLARKRGWIINIASMSAKIGPWGHSGYAAAKSAIVSLTQTLAAEHHDSGVRFSYVNPGIVETRFFTRPDTEAFWSTVRRRAVPVDRAADQIVRLLDRYQLELCIPRHYRLIDAIAAFSPGLAAAMVRRQSGP